MELEQAKKTLDELRRNDPVVQRSRHGELVAAFKAFWDSAPDEAVFTKYATGLLITPPMLYYMVEHPIWMRKDAEPEEPAAADLRQGPGDQEDLQKKPVPKKGGKDAHSK